MANKTKPPKRPPGRPPGREFAHIARIPFRPETWRRLRAAAAAEGKSAAQVVRELVERYLRRRG